MITYDENGKMIININGDKYTKRPAKNESPAMRRMKSIAVVAGVYGMTTAYKVAMKSKQVNYDKNVIEEFILIDAHKKGINQNKSKLSKRERDLIVQEFNKHYVLKNENN